MNEYFIILGQNSNLSTAELEAFNQREQLWDSFILCSEQVCVIRTEDDIDSQYLMSQLGGAVKIGRIVEVVAKNNLAPDIFIKHLPVEKKVWFGFSAYQLKGGAVIKNKLISKIALGIKSMLKDSEQPIRWVTSKEETLSSVVVKKNKLLTRGAEFVLLTDEANVRIGVTEAVQEFEEYSFRDFSRPGRDTVSGMIPPKLAKILINLSGQPKASTILDPFVGSGTIVQEALLMGYQNVLGSDLSAKAVADTKQNLDWLKEHFLFNGNANIWQADVRELSKNIKPGSVQAIVAEPFLGPPLRGRVTKVKIDKIINELTPFYIKAYQEFAKLLVDGGRVVILWPAFAYQNSFIYMPLIEQVKKAGFKMVPLSKLPSVELSERHSIIYARSGQHVAREITVWEKQG